MRVQTAPPPPLGKISAASFRVEQQAEYHGEIKVPSILFMGKAGGTGQQSLRSELMKYKLRPGALEEIADVDDGTASQLASQGKSDKKRVAFKDYDQQVYGGTREIRSAQRQISETETAAHESNAEAQRIMRETQTTASVVEEKINFVKENNTHLDSELVEIERQIEELKRISRSQIDEIRNLRQANKQKSEVLQDEQRELEVMEDTMKQVLASEKEADGTVVSPTKGTARTLRKKSSELDQKLFDVRWGELDGGYVGDLAEAIPLHEDLRKVMMTNKIETEDADFQVVGEELATVQPWRSDIREPSDWSQVHMRDEWTFSRPAANALFF